MKKFQKKIFFLGGSYFFSDSACIPEELPSCSCVTSEVKRCSSSWYGTVSTSGRPLKTSMMRTSAEYVAAPSSLRSDLNVRCTTPTATMSASVARSPTDIGDQPSSSRIHPVTVWKDWSRVVTVSIHPTMPLYRLVTSRGTGRDVIVSL